MPSLRVEETQGLAKLAEDRVRQFENAVWYLLQLDSVQAELDAGGGQNLGETRLPTCPLRIDPAAVKARRWAEYPLETVADLLAFERDCRSAKGDRQTFRAGSASPVGADSGAEDSQGMPSLGSGISDPWTDVLGLNTRTSSCRDVQQLALPSPRVDWQSQDRPTRSQEILPMDLAPAVVQGGAPVPEPGTAPIMLEEVDGLMLPEISGPRPTEAAGLPQSGSWHDLWELRLPPLEAGPAAAGIQITTSTDAKSPLPEDEDMFW